MKAVLHQLDSSIYLASDKGIGLFEVKDPRFICFGVPEIEYFPYCDDFGPMNASSIIEFTKAVDQMISRYPDKKIVYCAEPGVRAFTNAVFLMGAYLILKQNLEPDQVGKLFLNIHKEMIEGYRDATFSQPTFRLTLLDCWKGLNRGKSLGWFKYAANNDLWGSIIPEEYDHYENPLNGNLTVIVPGKFVAFQGPVDLGGKEFRDDPKTGHRSFSASYFVDIFRELDVRAVVRLNESHYDPDDFESAGIRHYDLEFEDCTAPPPEVVDRFLRIADDTKGLVAVHCKAGLGRTGTLIALHMMQTHGFSAREAIAWLRIMRPGCVIGCQQQYLAAVDRDMRRYLCDADLALSPPCSPLGGEFARGGLVEAADALARQVAEAMERRGGTRQFRAL